MSAYTIDVARLGTGQVRRSADDFMIEREARLLSTIWFLSIWLYFDDIRIYGAQLSWWFYYQADLGGGYLGGLYLQFISIAGGPADGKPMMTCRCQ